MAEVLLQIQGRLAKEEARNKSDVAFTSVAARMKELEAYVASSEDQWNKKALELKPA